MNVIAHRGNLYGPDYFLENHPNYLMSAIDKGFDVECDIWYEDGKWALGHDKPEYEIDNPMFLEQTGKVWYHCKNEEAIFFMANHYTNLNFFYHEHEPFVLTSFGYLWVHPETTEIAVDYKINGVYVVANDSSHTKDNFCSRFGHLCTDYAQKVYDYYYKG